jgi:hypothetical protein
MTAPIVRSPKVTEMTDLSGFRFRREGDEAVLIDNDGNEAGRWPWSDVGAGLRMSFWRAEEFYRSKRRGTPYERAGDREPPPDSSWTARFNEEQRLA